MAQKKLKILLNVGELDAHRFSVPKYKEGQLVTVDEDEANRLIDGVKCARLATDDDEDTAEEPEEAKRGKRTKPAEPAEPAEDAASPVEGESAPEAIERISRMRSTEKLEEIILTDDRRTVVEAAQTRLNELQSGQA